MENSEHYGKQRPCRIFRAGDYPDKKFSITVAELEEAAKEFSGPLQLQVDFTDGPLDYCMGRLVSVQVIGDELHGFIELADWFDNVFPGRYKRAIGPAWDRTTKRLIGVSLLTRPFDEAWAIL